MAAYRIVMILQSVILASLYRYTQTQNSAFAVTPGNIIAKLGSSARLDCQANKPNSTIRWSHGDQTMINFNECNCELLSNFSLYFSEITPSTGGEYVCLILGPPVAQISGSITIAVGPTITPHGFNIMRDQNDTFALNVNVTGIPQPDVTWLKDNTVFTSEETGVMVTTSGLQVTNAQYEAAGTYNIQATNCANTRSQTYNIFIKFLPIVKMTRNPDSNEVAMDTTVTVTCSVISYPGSSILWEQRISNEYTTWDAFSVNNNTSNMFSIITNSTIMFTGSEINGASSFCCTATNMIGTVMRCLDFGAPPAPSGFTATDSTPSSITVQWDSASSDEITYKLQYRVENSNEQWTVRQLQNDIINYTLNNLKSNTSYVVMITSVRNAIQSSSTMITVHTRIPVPGDVLFFEVDSILAPGIFVLTWMAPQESVVDHYIVHIRWQDNYDVMKIDGTKTSLNISNLSENVEYIFAMQAINDGGPGNITSYRSGIFCLTIPTLKVQYIPYGTAVNISWDLSDSVYSSRNVIIVVAESSRALFTSEPFNASYRHYCITNLGPNTRYEIKVIAVLGCDNVSSELDVLTQSFAPVTSPSLQNCIVLNLNTTESISEQSNSTTLEIWIIVLIVILLLLAAVFMLAIGVYCGSKKKYASHKDLELPYGSVTYTTPQAASNDHTTPADHSTNSLTTSNVQGANTIIQSQLSYEPQQNHSVPANTTQWWTDD